MDTVWTAYATAWLIDSILTVQCLLAVLGNSIITIHKLVWLVVVALLEHMAIYTLILASLVNLPVAHAPPLQLIVLAVFLRCWFTMGPVTHNVPSQLTHLPINVYLVTRRLTAKLVKQVLLFASPVSTIYFWPNQQGTVLLIVLYLLINIEIFTATNAWLLVRLTQLQTA